MRLEKVMELIKSGKFYECPKWRRQRKVALKRDNYECQDCKDTGGYSKATQVHHIKHLKDRPDLAFDLDNLRCLCVACHNRQHPERFVEFRLKQRQKKPPITEEWW